MIFLEQKRPRSFVEGPEGEGVGHKTLGHARGPRRALVGCSHLKAHLRVKPTPKNPTNREAIRGNHRLEVPRPQAYVATKNQSRPCSGTPPEGEIITGGRLHHPYGLHDEEGLVHPRG